MATPEQIAAGVPASANIVAQVADPRGGTLYLGSDGGIFATGGAQYQGGVNNLQGDTLAGQHQFGNNALVAEPNGGYQVTDTGGHQYAFGTPYTGPGAVAAPNPLYQDPSFLAFMRTSGLSADQAVRDYESSVGLAGRARDAALAELNDPFGARSTDRENMAQGYINRGFSGSGQQAKAITGYDTETANQKANDQATYSDAIGSAGQTLGNSIGGLAQKATEQGIDTGTNQGWQNFLTGEAKKFPDQAATIMGSGSAPSGTASGGS